MLLPLAAKLAALPPHVLTRYEDECSNYSVGWSHGREALVAGAPDVDKGSFYANPLLDKPAPGLPADVERSYSSLYSPNIWPDEHVPELKPAFTALGGLVCHIASDLLSHCHSLIVEHSGLHGSAQGASGSTSSASGLLRPVREQRCNKARLLHYYPKLTGDDGARLWCAWHTDHGTITGLVGALFLDPRLGHEVMAPDPTAGLHVRTRAGDVVRVQGNRHLLLFQAGQCLQIMSGGLLRATPHCVTAPSIASPVSRNTFAVFCQPNADDVLGPLVGTADGAAVGVPGWTPGITFGAFSDATISKNYL